jgi:glutathione S-transferase
VLDTRLQDVDYLAGEYSIADIANYAWVWGYQWAGVSIDGLDRLSRWLERIGEREGIRRGHEVPEPTDLEQMLRDADEKVETVRGILA